MRLLRAGLKPRHRVLQIPVKQKTSGKKSAKIKRMTSIVSCPKPKVCPNSWVTVDSNDLIFQSNPSLIQELHKISNREECKFWKRVAHDLEKPTRKRRIVNLSRISRYSKDNDVIIVPGKVLSAGVIDKKVTVAAFNFSHQAVNKIVEVGGKAMTINQLLSENPKGKDIKILG